MPMNGSTSGPYTISSSHSESTPARSSSSTAALNSPGTPADPREIPILTFTVYPITPVRCASEPTSDGRAPTGSDAGGGLLVVAAELLAHGRQRLVGEQVKLPGGEAGVQRAGEDRRRNAFLDGGDRGP